jgi:hypothetical protein
VLVIVVAMLVVLVVAGLVVVYVAYPHRGEELPAAPWLGEAMTRAADAAPLIEDDAEDHQLLHQEQRTGR